MSGGDDGSEVARITIQSHRGALIAAVQVDLDERMLRGFQADLLEQIRSTKARSVILDMASVQIVDATDFEELRRTIDMASLMGANTILCGLRPGVAASLVDLNVSTSGLRTCLNLDTALDQIGDPNSLDPDTVPDEQSENEGRINGHAGATALNPE